MRIIQKKTETEEVAKNRQVYLDKAGYAHRVNYPYSHRFRRKGCYLCQKAY